MLNPNAVQAVKDKRNLAEALFIREKTAPKAFWKSGDHKIKKMDDLTKKKQKNDKKNTKNTHSFVANSFAPVHTQKPVNQTSLDSNEN